MLEALDFCSAELTGVAAARVCALFLPAWPPHSTPLGCWVGGAKGGHGRGVIARTAPWSEAAEVARLYHSSLAPDQQLSFLGCGHLTAAAVGPYSVVVLGGCTQPLLWEEPACLCGRAAGRDEGSRVWSMVVR